MARLVVALLMIGAWAHTAPAAPADDVIRLRPANREADPEATPDAGDPAEHRRGFDYASFEARLESLWFQRKALLADGRTEDAARQSDQIRAFCSEEGVRRLEGMAGALVAEARRFIDEGHYDRALDSLGLAQAVDPGRPQVHVARASIYWKSGGGFLAAGSELLSGVSASIRRSLQNLSLFNQLALVLVIATAGCVLLFSVLMLFRYQVPFRHEIEEWAVQFMDARLVVPLGWAVLFLPLLLWFAAGWIVLYWIIVTFRFMSRSERLAAAVLLLAAALTVPAYRTAVTIYGTTADPAVRTTLDSAGGEYDPDRVLRLQQLVRAHPTDPVYRFLLGGLYKNGRYFEDAFAEYKKAIELHPAMGQAFINTGNIFFTTGQYAEAVAHYRAAADIDPQSMLAYFNLHLTQSEMFRFKEAEESLNRARAIDSKLLAQLLSRAGSDGDRPMVIDAQLKMSSVWDAALEGSRPQLAQAGAGAPNRSWARGLINPISIVALVSLAACVGLLLAGREVARRCIRCGRPFCHYCKSGREGHEYCSQCLHLFVLGDGLAHETKNRKLYEVERYERLTRVARRWVSLALPGAAQMLRGRAAAGVALLLLWVAAIVAWQPLALRPVEMLTGLDLRLDLLSPSAVPTAYGLNAFALLGLFSLPLVWIAGNVWRLRRT